MQIGILALQGDFTRHMGALKALGVGCCEVRTARELERFHGLILPGGESTRMRLQIVSEGLDRPLHAFAEKKPVFGTCAGLILMAKKLIVSGTTVENSLGWMEMSVERNGYGRQVNSFQERLSLTLPLLYSSEMSISCSVQAIFIRAPRIRNWGAGVIVLAERKQEPVFVQQGMHLAATFHPELTEDRAMHRYFLDVVEKCRFSGAI